MSKKESEYATLSNKYNRLLARLKDLEQQIESKEAAWSKLETEYKNNESLARELCEKILAKDPNEMVLGTGYSWRTLSTAELLRKSKICFEDYNARRTYLMLRLKDESEDRRMQIESLVDQLSSAKLSKPAVNEETGEVEPISALSRDEIMEKTKKEISDKKVKDAIPQQLKSAEEKGNCQIVVIEENKDFVEQDALDNAEAGLIGHTVKVDAYSAPMHPSEENRQDKQRRKIAEKYTELIDVEAAASGIKEAGWNALQAIGKYGVSTTADITAILQSKITNGEKTLANRAIAQLTALQAGGIVEKSVITDGIRSKLMIYTISPKGKKIYEHKFGEAPVVSEAERLRAENDNIQHGYGIKALQEVLTGLVDADGKRIYTSVTISRNKNTIQLKSGTKYIPDAKASNGVGVDFFEYEMGLQTYHDYEVKLNKMCQVTGNIRIVYPSTEILNENTSKIEKWINNRGSSSLSGIQVYLYTTRSISKTDVENGWICRYDCKQGATKINALKAEGE